MILQHAGAPQLEKAQVGMRGNEGRDVELCLGVEAAMGFRHFLAQ